MCHDMNIPVLSSEFFFKYTKKAVRIKLAKNVLNNLDKDIHFYDKKSITHQQKQKIQSLGNG